jgi:hypothetical protein
MAVNRLGALAVLLLGSALLRTAGAAPEPTVLDCLYITSTVDMSAGGHTALRFGQTVYHFQLCDGGLFLLTREPWSEFRYTRNDLGNRSITMHRIPLSRTPYDMIRENCLAFYLRQERRLQILHRLEAERDLLHRLAAGDNQVAVKGLGLFSSGMHNEVYGLALRRRIYAQLGPQYLREAAQGAGARLRSSDLRPVDIPRDSLDGMAALRSGCSEALEALQLYEALCVLDEARPLEDDVLLLSDANNGPLNDPELAAVVALHDDIVTSIITLLETARPDSGEALLLQTARYHATSCAIERRRLVTLDPFSDAAQPKPISELSGREPCFDLLLGDAAYDVAALRVAVTRLKGEERRLAYGRLEDSQGRLHDLERLAHGDRPLRTEPGYLVPSRSRRVPIMLDPSGNDFGAYASKAERNATVYRAYMRDSARYNLFTRNCVTELVRLINTSFASRAEAARALGGHLEPGGSLSFIPRRFSERVCETYNVSETLEFPSYRLRRLAELREGARDGGWLPEGNTFTSTIYSPWHADTTFLFFTDDVFWPRPLLGTANVIYAHAHAAGGIVMLPFDHGRHLRRSLRGILFSLPELAFSNIRKGSFQAVPYCRSP